MRVLVVSAWPPWLVDDGAALVLHHHLRLLEPRHDIRVLTTSRDERHPPIDYFRRRIASELTREPAHVHWVERPALLTAYRRVLASDRPDVVHLHGWGTAQLARYAPDTPALHVAIDAWATGWSNRLLPRWRRLTDAGQLAKVRTHERRHYPRCGAVVVVGPDDAAYLTEHAPGARIEVVPNGVELGPSPVAGSDQPVVGFHGAFETGANVNAARHLVERVLPLVRARRPDARVMLIGRAPQALAGLAGPGVVITGRVPDIRDALSAVAVYAAPLVSGSGLKNKVLEAMAAGLPIVATAMAVSGIGASDGITVACSPDAMAEAILAFLGSADARRTAGHANRERVGRDFTWERSACRIEGLWEELAR